MLCATNKLPLTSVAIIERRHAQSFEPPSDKGHPKYGQLVRHAIYIKRDRDLGRPGEFFVAFARLGEVVREQFRFWRGGDATTEQDFSNTTMQDLAPAIEQILISRILNKSVLEAIIGVCGTPCTSRISASASRAPNLSNLM